MAYSSRHCLLRYYWSVRGVQESLRHANSRITLYTYTQASTPAK